MLLHSPLKIKKWKKQKSYPQPGILGTIAKLLTFRRGLNWIGIVNSRAGFLPLPLLPFFRAIIYWSHHNRSVSVTDGTFFPFLEISLVG